MVDRRLARDGPTEGVMKPETMYGGRRAYRAACGRLWAEHGSGPRSVEDRGQMVAWWQAGRAACGRQSG